MLTSDVIPYIISGAVCFTMAVVLFLVKPSFRSIHKEYFQIKVLLACSALSDVITDILMLACNVDQINPAPLNLFWIPVIYYFQICMMTFAMLALIQSDILPLNRLKWFVLPVLFLVLVHVFGYLLLSNSISFSLLDYFNFTSLHPLSAVLNDALLMIVITESLFCLVLLIVEARRYLLLIENGRAKGTMIEGTQLSNLLFAYIAYFVLAAVDLVLPFGFTGHGLVLVNTILFLVFSICLLNMQDVFYRIKKAKQEEEERVHYRNRRG